MRNLPTAMLALLLVAFGLALAPVAAAADDLDLGDDLIEDFAKEIGADTRAGVAFRLVRADAPGQSIEGSLHWRSVPGSVAAETFPAKVEIGGNVAIGPRDEVLPDDLGMTVVYEPFGRAPVPDGRSELYPGRIPVTMQNGRLTAQHPAVRVTDQGVSILCAPVRFTPVTPEGSPAPTRIQISDGHNDLLRADGPFSLLTVWLPVGVKYSSSFGSFTLAADGTVAPEKLAPHVEADKRGLRLTLASPARGPAAAEPPAETLHLFLHRGRTVFAETEQAVGWILAPRGFKGGPVTLRAGDAVLGQVEMPPVTDSNWDSRGFSLTVADLPPGRHELRAQAEGAAAAPLPITVVRWEPRSGFFVHSMSGCTGTWPTTDEGLDLLSGAGLDMLTATGFTGLLTVEMPRLAAPRDPRLPAEAGLIRSPNDLLLERTLARRLRLIDMATVRAVPMYLESLSYHHSYKPSVDRTVRRMSVFTHQAAEYPSFWGVNYTWFPKPGGYAESGVPTDAHVGDRNAAARARMKALGAETPSRDDLGWYADHTFSADPAERARALDILKRRIAAWKAWNTVSFGDHNVIYNAAIRQVRPDMRCTLFDNAGHDADNRARSQFNGMEAACYESYTDYGEWPMSAAFTTEWALGSNPGRPVWLTVDWGTSTEGQVKSLFHAFFRGLPGGGVPMQAENGMAELARRAKGLRLIQQYGSIGPHARPDRRVAILATLSQRMFDGRAYYACHAIYYHLTRLGYPAIIVDEEDALSHGIPAGVKALFIVRQQQPMQPELLDVLRKFQGAGGRILATGDSTVELDGVTKVGGPVLDIWRLSGFEGKVHQDMWEQFLTVWRAPLAEAMAGTGLPTLAHADPERGLALAMDAGPLRYVLAIADSANSHAREFRVTPELAVSVEGTGWQVRNLVHQADVPAADADGRCEFRVALITEPVALLALYRSPPAQVHVEAAGEAFRARVTAADGGDLGPVPVLVTIRDPAGAVYDSLYRAAGDAVSLRVPAHAPAGAWTVEAQELLTGLAASHTWTPPAPAGVRTAQPIADVQVVDEAHVRAFVAAEGEKVIVIEPGQAAWLPLANDLLAKLKAAGVKARLWEVKPDQYDSIPVRWYPRAEDTARLAAVEAGELIGYREDLTPYIDKKRRVHVPQRGGYPEIEPKWMVGTHAILFSGGGLAESLRAVTAWMPTPNIPGPRQGRLLVCFNPFMAGRHIAVVAANDAEGMGKAAARLAEFFTAPPQAAAPPPSPALAWKPAATGQERKPVATPLVGLTPYRRSLQLATAADGRAMLRVAGQKDNIAIIGTDGTVAGTFALPGTEFTVDRDGLVWGYSRGEGVVTGVGVNTGGEIVRRFEADWGTAGGMNPPNRSFEASFLAAPAGGAVAAGRHGGLMLGRLGEAAWRLYDDVPHVRHRYEIWNPRFPVGMAFSPDGGYLFFTMDTRPTGFTNMSGYAFNPAGAEAVLLDVRTGQRVWAQRENPALAEARPHHFGPYVMDSCAFVTHSGFAAVAADGALTALADYVGQALLIDKAGQVVLCHQAGPDAPIAGRSYSSGPPRGVGVCLSDGGELAVFGYTDKLVLARRERVVEVPLESLAACAVEPRGTVALAGLESGEVIALDPAGKEKWRFASGGLSPRLAAPAADRFLVATHAAELIQLDAAGQPVWRTDVAKAVDTARHPARPAATLTGLGPPLSYREPDTLAVAKAMLRAEAAAAWELAGTGHEAFGRTFHPVGEPIRLAVGDAGEAFLHLVYRRGADSKPVTVVAKGKGAEEKFVLDLPTPEYRVVDIPARGPGIEFTVSGEGRFEVAECSAWRFTWPGPNVAYVQEAAAGGDATRLTESEDKSLEGLEDLLDIEQTGTAQAGALKDTEIYAWNPDPDKVQGVYFRPAVNPLKVVDGQRFGNGRMGAWSGKDIIGPWLTETFPYPTALSLVATYERDNRQSQVSTYLAVFAEFNPEGGRDSGRVLAGAIDNDQFWRLFPIRGVKVRSLGVHVRAAGGRHGLSEVEAYPLPE